MRRNLPGKCEVNLGWGLNEALLSKIPEVIQRSETAVGNLEWTGRKISLTYMNPLVNSLEIIAGLLEINLRFLFHFLFPFPDNFFYN